MIPLGMTPEAGMDHQTVRFDEEHRVSICWAGCSAPGTGRLGLCERHEVEVLGTELSGVTP